MPRLLDLFCGAGGVAMGYHRAGFEVVGVDLAPQKNYPFEFHQADALTFPLEGFDVIHASPPCQAFSVTRNAHPDIEHPDLLRPTIERFAALDMPWVIENVQPAPIDGIVLCGAMFSDLNVYRHRVFASNVLLLAPPHPRHIEPIVAMGRPPRAGHRMAIAGHWSGVAAGREAMGIDWMTIKELAQAIPPAYTEFIGKQIMRHLDGVR